MHENIGGQLHKLRIHFRDPREYLDVSRFEEMSYLAGFLPSLYARGAAISIASDSEA